MSNFPYKYPFPDPEDTWFTDGNYRELEEENYPRTNSEPGRQSPYGHEYTVPRETVDEEQRTGDEPV